MSFFLITFVLSVFKTRLYLESFPIGYLKSALYFTRAYDGMLFNNTDSLQEESQRSVIKN